uniref:Zinc-ribbon domain-containing protein n=1 Tax=Gadus morhua TaxID=8049 RepID=A0A8C5AQ68_GADMO
MINQRLFCPQCGTKLQADFRFCPSCGEKFPAPLSVSITPHVFMRFSACVVSELSFDCIGSAHRIANTQYFSIGGIPDSGIVSEKL